ncbi:MAG: ArsC family transcriptional regulator [Clostridiales bacterium]|nr:arsenate reductase family protein [Bacillota bacterium]MEE0516317.1 arsenate reductase family protein [Anaerovoracaceae bacterium]PWL93217.1 MAG: ArsC family transcriptional regulator [Clostridiales bacterium]
MLVIGYPKCTTVKKAKKWLDENGYTYEERNIKEQPPTYEELKEWHKLSGLPIKKLFNTSGMVYKSLNLKDKLLDMTEDEQLRLLSTDGMLVKRPVIIDGDKVWFGFKGTL